MAEIPYIGRFAPSPTGPLHTGSLVAAMASYLDAKAHQGQWLVRIEDIDEARTVPGAAESILQCLAVLGMHSDGDVAWQSERGLLYQAAFEQLHEYIYPCACSRREIADSRLGMSSDGAAIFRGTCRNGLQAGKAARAFRLRVPEPREPEEYVVFEDRWAKSVAQHLAKEAGDFVLKRADGYWAYQLAVVVDDAAQGVTHVVRGADLIDSTARQIYLQRLLQVPTPDYLHVPTVMNRAGEKLSKQTGAPAIDLSEPKLALHDAANFLGLTMIGQTDSIADFWNKATTAWVNRFLNR